MYLNFLNRITKYDAHVKLTFLVSYTRDTFF